MLKSVEIKDSYDKIVRINDQLATQVKNSESSPTGAAGCCRSVYVTDEYVIKFGNVGETKLFIDDEDKKFFAEVVYVDIANRWMVQKRVNCVPNAELNRAAAEEILKMVEKYGIDDVAIYKSYTQNRIIAHNWTIDVDGVPKIFDYDFSDDDRTSKAAKRRFDREGILEGMD